MNRRCPDRGRGARARVDVRVVAIARAVDRRRRDRARRARARGRARAARPRTRNTKSVVARASREGNFLDTVYHASRPPSRSRRARAFARDAPMMALFARAIRARDRDARPTDAAATGRCRDGAGSLNPNTRPRATAGDDGGAKSVRPRPRAGFAGRLPPSNRARSARRAALRGQTSDVAASRPGRRATRGEASAARAARRDDARATRPTHRTQSRGPRCANDRALKSSTGRRDRRALEPRSNRVASARETTDARDESSRGRARVPIPSSRGATNDRDDRTSSHDAVRRSGRRATPTIARASRPSPSRARASDPNRHP